MARADRPAMGISSASVALEGALWLAVGVGLALGAALLLLWLGRASEGLALGGAAALISPLLTAEDIRKAGEVAAPDLPPMDQRTADVINARAGLASGAGIPPWFCKCTGCGAVWALEIAERDEWKCRRCDAPIQRLPRCLADSSVSKEPTGITLSDRVVSSLSKLVGAMASAGVVPDIPPDDVEPRPAECEEEIACPYHAAGGEHPSCGLLTPAEWEGREALESAQRENASLRRDLAVAEERLEHAHHALDVARPVVEAAFKLMDDGFGPDATDEDLVRLTTALGVSVNAATRAGWNRERRS